MELEEFRGLTQLSRMAPGEYDTTGELWSIRGTVKGVRRMGGKLGFLEISPEGSEDGESASLQVLSQLEGGGVDMCCSGDP